MINNVDDFMEFYRRDDFHSLINEDACDEIFFGILKGSSDLTKEKLKWLCEYYGTTLNDVLNEEAEEEK